MMWIVPNLSRFVSWPRIWSILVNVLGRCQLQEVGWLCCSSLLTTLIFLLVYKLLICSINSWGVLKFLTIIVNLFFLLKFHQVLLHIFQNYVNWVHKHLGLLYPPDGLTSLSLWNIFLISHNSLCSEIYFD